MNKVQPGCNPTHIQTQGAQGRLITVCVVFHSPNTHRNPSQESEERFVQVWEHLNPLLLALVKGQRHLTAPSFTFCSFPVHSGIPFHLLPPNCWATLLLMHVAMHYTCINNNLLHHFLCMLTYSRVGCSEHRASLQRPMFLCCIA